jgi:hypothetical protein
MKRGGARRRPAGLAVAAQGRSVDVCPHAPAVAQILLHADRGQNCLGGHHEMSVSSDGPARWCSMPVPRHAIGRNGAPRPGGRSHSRGAEPTVRPQHRRQTAASSPMAAQLIKKPSLKPLLAGRDPLATVVHHCGSGVSAVPEHDRHGDTCRAGTTAALYAGSWSEWCSDPATSASSAPRPMPRKSSPWCAKPMAAGG